MPVYEEALPRFQLHSPAVDFIENKLPDYHDAFDQQDIRFDCVSDQFLSTLQPHPIVPIESDRLIARNVNNHAVPRPLPSPVGESDSWHGNFLRAMLWLKETPEPKHCAHMRYSIRDQTTWKDVQDQLVCARCVYEDRDTDLDGEKEKPQDDNRGEDDDNGKIRCDKKGRGIQRVTGNFKRKIRSAGEKVAVPLEQGMKLVPNHPIATPVLSAVSLVLDAWKVSATVRNDVHCAFDNIESLLCDIELYDEMFPGDENIINASTNLTLVTFIAIEKAIEFYTSYQVVRFSEALLQGEDYQKQLRSSLDQIQTQAKNLRRHAKKSFYWVLLKHARKDVGVYAINRIYSMLEEVKAENFQNRNYIAGLISRSRAPSPQPFLERPACTPEMLWKLINVPNLDEDDMETIMSKARALDYEDRGRAERIVDTSLFRNWLLGRGPPKLLIHGDFDQGQFMRVSPLSVVCTSFVQALRTQPGYVSLVFFCGTHYRPNQEYKGGISIVRSFIAQLLTQVPACPDSLAPDISLDEVGNGNMQHLQRLLISLINALPEQMTAIFLIDGVNFYEHQFKDELEQVLAIILDLAEGDGTYIPVKVLITSPRDTRHLRVAFKEPESLLSMRSILYTGSSKSRLERRWASDLNGPF